MRWGTREHLQLMTNVENLVAGGNTVTEACEILTRRKPYRQMGSATTGRSLSPKTIRRQYYEAKRDEVLTDFIRGIEAEI